MIDSSPVVQGRNENGETIIISSIHILEYQLRMSSQPISSEILGCSSTAMRRHFQSCHGNVPVRHSNPLPRSSESSYNMMDRSISRREVRVRCLSKMEKMLFFLTKNIEKSRISGYYSHFLYMKLKFNPSTVISTSLTQL